LPWQSTTWQTSTNGNRLESLGTHLRSGCCRLIDGSDRGCHHRQCCRLATSRGGDGRMRGGRLGYGPHPTNLSLYRVGRGGGCDGDSVPAIVSTVCYGYS